MTHVPPKEAYDEDIDHFDRRGGPVAGISIAGAQGTMSKDKTGSMSSSAKITGTGKFRVKEDSGAWNCQYASLSACQQANAGKDCQQNPKSTTGSK